MIMIVLLLIFVFLMMFMYNSNKIEHYRSYTQIEADRDDMCLVYADSFFNAHINTKEEVRQPFLNWCEDYNKSRQYYPQYRAAEMVFLRFRNKYDR